MAIPALEQENHQGDAEFNRVLHGKSAQAKGGFAAMRCKNATAQKAALDEYFKHWDNKSAEEETEEIRAVGTSLIHQSLLLEKLVGLITLWLQDRRAEYATLTKRYVPQILSIATGVCLTVL